jgi:hypothetical protein
MHRLALSLAVLAVSAPSAMAQVDHQSAMRDLDLMNRQQMQQQRSIALENQFNALDARVQTEQRLRDVEVMRTRPSMTTKPGAAMDSPGAGGFAAMPDDMLAASNARVREASQNRR